jgi:hypothetical protein
MILQQLQSQIALYDTQRDHVNDLQQQLQQQVANTLLHCLPPIYFFLFTSDSSKRDVTAQEVAAHAATSREVQSLQQQVQRAPNYNPQPLYFL